MSDTLRVIERLLIERNARERDPFVSIHEANATLLNQVDALQARCDVAERALVVLQAQLAGSTPSKAGALAATAALKNESRLRDKLEKLQEEYNAKLKAEAHDKALVLEKTQELSQKKELVTSLQNQLKELESAINKKEQAIQHLGDQVSEAQQSTQLAEQQYEGLKRTIRELQADNDALKRENRHLEDRIVSEKRTLLDEMNQVTELMEALKTEVDMLRAYKAQEELRSKGWLGGLSSTKSDGKSHEADREEGRRFGDIGVVVPSEPKQIIAAHSMEGTRLRYEPSGTGLLATASSDATVKVWDANHGNLRATLRGSPGSSIIGCDLSNTLVVGAGSDKTCRVWNLRTQRMIHHLVGHAHKITCVRLFGHDKFVVTGSADRCLKVWDISSTTYKQTTTLRHSSTSNCVDVASDSITAVSGHLDGGIRLWNLRTGERTADLACVHEAAATSVQFDPRDNAQLLTNGMDACLKLIDIRTGIAVHTFRHPDFQTTQNWSSAAFSPDGRYAIAGSNSCGDIFVWDTSDGSLKQRLKHHAAGVCGIDWGRGSQQVASIDRKGTLVLWA